MARLLFRDSQGREGAVELSPTETVYVGRGLECAIRTDDGMVSRRHSQVRMEGGRFVVEDLGSANGTILNNVRVQKQALGHADTIQCGSLTLKFIDEGAVNVMPQQVAIANVAPPAKKGGTMVLERPEAPPLPSGPAPGAPNAFGGANPNAFGGSSSPGGGYGAPSPSGYGGAPPGGGYGAPPPSPYGGPPAMPGGGPPAMPGGGPPAMPAGGGGYGGPPPMP